MKQKLDYINKVINSCKTYEQLSDAEMWAYKVICTEIPTVTPERSGALTLAIKAVQIREEQLIKSVSASIS